MIGVIALGACVMNPLSDAPTTVELPTSFTGPPVVVDVPRGSAWTKRAGIGVVQFNSLPNLAIWVEKPDGTFVDTLYVTGADYAQLRHGGKQQGADWWVQSLPVWSAAVQRAGRALPSKEAPYADGVTGATPPSSFQLRTRLPGPADDARLRLEVNTSADYNEAYTKADTDWVGQPSVVYEARLSGAAGASPHELAPIGVGAPGGVLDPDLSKVDTALQILGDVQVRLD